MINELHVSLITQLKGVQREGDSGGERDEHGALVLLWPPFVCRGERRLIYGRKNVRRTCNQSDKVKQPAQLPGGIIAFNRKFHLVVGLKRLGCNYVSFSSWTSRAN